ncbi:hypothetical protein [Xylanimonas sp. McL0601]|uniref:hypothetical protein n=1 Tax=Xylanimonas sp. McL0601 TaxID=3414739 RepID=UPI003CF90BA4
MAEVVVELASLVAQAGAKVAFGEKVDVDGATLVPVALAIYGVGGGQGPAGSDDAGPLGSGGGGGSLSVPLGAYVGREGTVRFVPNVVALLFVSIPLTIVAGRALARIARALR